MNSKFKYVPCANPECSHTFLNVEFIPWREKGFCKRQCFVDCSDDNGLEWLKNKEKAIAKERDEKRKWYKRREQGLI